ncbi:glucan endo-1,3-beta-D-glucosidase [Impatiens glandulifera]|uniref:glucan endo-1,3-beta-D-glucosidase n=1 Tax=Impatiens glandulifera TaxID=253017 RepID=UPI001FB08F8A|nr:glucan endo-1,3-beta-D-glucosidase [Impatiens glandulifera]
MAKVIAAFSIFVLISSFLSVGGNLKTIKAQKTWCVPKPSLNEGTLMENINFACSEVDCKKVLQKGLPCYSPDNLMNHAAIAMNLYYQCKGRNKWNCDFKNSGLITLSDPSYDNCVFE